jgi:hypothetical protein
MSSRTVTRPPAPCENAGKIRGFLTGAVTRGVTLEGHPPPVPLSPLSPSVTRGRKKSLSEQHRKYFNEKAAHWDQMVEDKTLQGLDLIIKGLEIKPGSVVLDVGTGTGILIPFLQEAVGDSGSIVALDLAEEMLKRAKEKHGEQVRYVQGDIVNTPLRTIPLMK